MDLRRVSEDGSVHADRVVRIAYAFAVLMLAGYASHALFNIGGHGLDGFFHQWVNDAIVLIAASACLWRAVKVKTERLPWALFSLGMMSWTAGNLYFSIFLINKNPMPIPSVADALFLSTYPPTIIAICLLVRSRVKGVGLGLTLDGLIAALGIASVSATIVVEQVLKSSAHLSTAAVATNLAYPLCDLLLLGLMIAALAMTGWRIDRMWAILAGGLATFAVTDGLFLVKLSNGTYVPGTILDAGWLLGALLLGAAAWAPVGTVTETLRGNRLQTGSGFFGLIGLAILIWDHFERVDTLALVLSSATVLAVIVRMAVVFSENLRRARRETEQLVLQNARLLELDALRDGFISVVSHELRTPLTSIRGFLELLQDGEGGPVTGEQRHMMGVIDRNANRLLHLVNDLLFVDRVDAGRLALELGPTDLDELATHSVEAARAHAAEQEIELVIELGSLPITLGDPGRLGQLLDNLISNALKFTPPRGKVTVRTGYSGDSASIEVEDTGIGIEPADQEHLFERFFRTQAAEKTAIPGTGLGLSISQAIARAHNGWIGVTSQVGIGTTCRVDLPLVPVGPDPLPAPTALTAA